MNEKLLVLLVAALVGLTLVGMAMGLGPSHSPVSELGPADLSRASKSLRGLGEWLGSSRSVRASELSGCELSGQTLRVAQGTRTTCRIAKSDFASRRLRMHLERGRVEVTTQTNGERATKVEARLAARGETKGGEMPIPNAGGAVTVRCRSGPCSLVFDRSEK